MAADWAPPKKVPGPGPFVFGFFLGLLSFVLPFPPPAFALRPMIEGSVEREIAAGLEEPTEETAARYESALNSMEELTDQWAFLRSQRRTFRKLSGYSKPSSRKSREEFMAENLLSLADGLLGGLYPQLKEARRTFEEARQAHPSGRLPRTASAKASRDVSVVPEGAFDLSQWSVPVRAQRVSKSPRPTRREIDWLAQAFEVEKEAVQESLTREMVRPSREISRKFHEWIADGLRPKGEAAFQWAGALYRTGKKIASRGEEDQRGVLVDWLERRGDLKGLDRRQKAHFRDQAMSDFHYLTVRPALEDTLRYARWFGEEETMRILRCLDSLPGLLPRVLPQATVGFGGFLDSADAALRGAMMARLFLNRRVSSPELRLGELAREISPEDADSILNSREFLLRHLVATLPAEIVFTHASAEGTQLLGKYELLIRFRVLSQRVASCAPEEWRKIHEGELRALKDLLKDPSSAVVNLLDLLAKYWEGGYHREVSKKVFQLEMLRTLAPAVGLLLDFPGAKDEAEDFARGLERELIFFWPQISRAALTMTQQAGLLRLALEDSALGDFTQMAKRLAVTVPSQGMRERLFGSAWDHWDEPEWTAWRNAFRYLVSRGDVEAWTQLFDELNQYIAEAPQKASRNPHTLAVLLMLADHVPAASPELKERAAALLLRSELLDRVSTVTDWKSDSNHERLVQILQRIKSFDPAKRMKIFGLAHVQPEEFPSLLQADLRPQGHKLLGGLIPFDLLPSGLAQRPLPELVGVLVRLAPEVSGQVLGEVALLDPRRAAAAQVRLNYFHRKAESGVVKDYAMQDAANHYALLGIGQEFTEDELKRAYRALVRVFHPDSFPGDAQAMKEFPLITAAHRTLGNASHRRQYNGSILWEAVRPWPSDVDILPAPSRLKHLLALPSGEENASEQGDASHPVGLEERAFSERFLATGV